VSELSAVVFV